MKKIFNNDIKKQIADLASKNNKKEIITILENFLQDSTQFKKGSNEYYQWLEETVNKIRAENDAKTKKGMRGEDEKDYGG